MWFVTLQVHPCCCKWHDFLPVAEWCPFICTRMCTHLYMHTYVHAALYAHVCVHTFICTCMCTHLYMHTYVHTPLYAHICVHTFMCTHLYVHTPLYAHVCARTFICTRMCAHLYIHTYVHAPLYTHVCVHTFICTHMCTHTMSLSNHRLMHIYIDSVYCLLWIVLLWISGRMYLFEFCFPPDVYPGVGLPDHTVALFSVFWGISILLSHSVHQLTFPPTVQEGFFFSTPSAASIICRLSDLTSVRWSLVVVLICIYLTVSNAEHLFMCLLIICISSSEKCLQSIFLLDCLFLMLSCMSCLYILEINPLSVASFANIFSPILKGVFCLQFPLLCKTFKFN